MQGVKVLFNKTLFVKQTGHIGAFWIFVNLINYKLQTQVTSMVNVYTYTTCIHLNALFVELITFTVFSAWHLIFYNLRHNKRNTCVKAFQLVLSAHLSKIVPENVIKLSKGTNISEHRLTTIYIR